MIGLHFYIWGFEGAALVARKGCADRRDALCGAGLARGAFWGVGFCSARCSRTIRKSQSAAMGRAHINAMPPIRRGSGGAPVNAGSGMVNAYAITNAVTPAAVRQHTAANAARRANGALKFIAAAGVASPRPKTTAASIPIANKN